VTPPRRAAAPLAALLAVCLAAAAPGAQSAWTELRGDRFVLRGALEADRLAAIACDVQIALETLGLPGTAPTLSIVAAANAGAVRELVPQYWERRGPRPLAAYWTGIYGHHVVIRTDTRRDERVRRLLHELAHFATRLAHPDPPRWLDEGMSELWEHATVEAGYVEVGRAVPAHLKLLRAQKNDRHWIPIAELLSADTLPVRGREAHTPMFYAQSWALMHYLLLKKGAGKVALEGLPAPDEFPGDSELRDYVRGALAPPARVAMTTQSADCAGRLEARSVPLVESLILKARALTDGERPDAALPLLAQALAREPNHAGALETQGVVHFVGNRFRESAAVFDRLIAEGRGSHLAYYYRALLAAPVPALSDGSGPVPALDYLREALRLEPGFQPAHDRMREMLRKNVEF